jgi:anaerobic selenocysteine-containing dehydrogenase
MLLCRPVFAHYAELCARYSPERLAEIAWIAPNEVEAAAELIWRSRPVSYYAWSGHEHHANTTETARAMALLYALTGSFDQRGGNVLFASVPNPTVTGEDLPAARRMAPAVGLEQRPLGPAKWNNVSAADFCRAVIEGDPYAICGLIDFGSNLLLAFSDPVKGRRALSALDFYAHADLFMNPTAELADIVLPVASCFEREALSADAILFPRANDPSDRFVETAERVRLQSISQHSHQEPAWKMGRRFAAQVGAPLTAQPIEIEALKVGNDRQNGGIERQRSARR